jgi:hypothetical protein
VGSAVKRVVYVVGFLAFANVVKTVASHQPSASPAKPETSQSVPTNAAPAPQESEDQKVARVKAELQEKAEVLAVRDLVDRTYGSVKDKGSMEIVRAKTDVKDKRLSACMVFTAKNGFGGVNEGQAVWVITAGKADGRFAIDQPKIWEQHCTGARGTLRTGEALEMLAYLHSR